MITFGGQFADFVVLAKDFPTVDSDRIREIRVECTVVGGRTVFEG